MKTLFLVCLSLLSGCMAVVRGSPLSSELPTDRGLFLSTGTPARKYRTLGFIQVRGYGQEWGGYGDIGDAQLDGTIHTALTREAAKMGGQGVIHIEFLDENPSTDAERAQRAAAAVGSLFSGNPRIETKERYVTVSGEVIVFVE